MPRASLVLATLLAVALLPLPASGQGSDDAWRGQVFAAKVSAPVDISFGRDGTLYYAELDSGKIRAIPPGANAPLPEAVAQVASVRGENGGFLGLALDPEFATTGAFFVYYSTEKAGAPAGKVNRVSRIDTSGERVILDDIPWDELHNGGRLVFTGPDTLVVATGDNELREPAQDPASLLGKTLRMTREGRPAPDNPDPTSLVYTLGHRNPFGLAYDPESDTLWETENGPQTRDEINILVPGGNYGWPKTLGVYKSRTYLDPVFVYEDTIAPTGATVLDGDLYLGAVNDASVRRLAREGEAFVESTIWTGKEPILDVEAGPDGRLYAGGFSTIYVLTPPGMSPPATPATPSAPATPASPSAGTPPASSPAAGTPPAATTPAAQEPASPTGAAQIPALGLPLTVAVLAGVVLALGRRRR